MRAKASAKKDRTSEVVRTPWRVVSVQVVGDYRLRVRFADGTEGDVDLGPLLFDDDPGVFAPLKDPAVFAQVYVDEDAVTWPGGLDLAPDAMYDDIKATGRRIVGRSSR
ncbi:MAG TPA: DUF2442 domain-containing protein [Gemmatimonadaceae bacterium]|nr:DUF2442 domain-containing protein [Gemmatimonadaceae bacterium]